MIPPHWAHAVEARAQQNSNASNVFLKIARIPSIGCKTDQSQLTPFICLKLKKEPVKNRFGPNYPVNG